MTKTALVIMAAGIGSRFGGGIKQLAPVGPSGEIIMDYSIHDALEAGFNKVVFIIRKSLEKDFKEIIGNRIEQLCEVEYAFQEVDDLPPGFSLPEGRTKPWGTGQAVLMCRFLLKEPFVVINADDYYGKMAFRKVHDFLVEHADSPYSYCMAGFKLKNTLSDNGTVTRGLCQISPEGKLQEVIETYNILKTEDGACVENTKEVLNPDASVSMNMWGLTPAFLKILEDGFIDFLKYRGGELKSEYLLPTIIERLLKVGKIDVTVLETTDKWFGVTYMEDKPAVEAAFADLIEKGVYTSPLNGAIR